MLNIIVCVDNNHAIGCNGKLLYHIKEDMVRFKSLTMNSVVIMGSKTLLSLPNSEPLKNRKNIVLTNNDKLKKDYCNYDHNILEFSSDINDIIKRYKFSEEQAWVIGGASIYKQFEKHCQSMYITQVFSTNEYADAFFKPDYDSWVGNLMDHNINDDNGLQYEFKLYQKILAELHIDL